MTEKEFPALVSRIRSSMNCSRDIAAEYAAAIGDIPEVENGRILVRNEEGRIIAYVPVSMPE